MVGGETSVAKAPEQFVRSEEAEFMHLTRAASATVIGDLVVEMQAGTASLDFDPAHAADADAMSLAGVTRYARRVEYARRKPRLYDEHAARRQVLAKTRERRFDAIEAAKIAN